MPKPPFRPIFQVASAKKDSKIHIINEPLGSSPKGSFVFLVETGESRTIPETREILEWIAEEMNEGLIRPAECQASSFLEEVPAGNMEIIELIGTSPPEGP
ncbi:hypothetical protein [Dehalogenimonas etheniformans]|uniref:Uncharacterized protein n=1 Tax=Dehalogenimonas etheniformans TaxID=1536648 RepID=A0A2P5P9W4_9CHLR|nr:hypothetical protein [Dehalogenimonas etheniformans]PPD59099.1 hypothetical protein JP09_000760 [Dehalogenimonas etheniformans]QNT76780.1 hypothetical protein HX448_08860 [Dehalogenimonas etheniformans]